MTSLLRQSIRLSTRVQVRAFSAAPARQFPTPAESGGTTTAKPPGSNQSQGKEGEHPLSSEGSVGKHFNPDGTIGQVGEKIGGPFSKDGAIGSQFNAKKDGIAGKVEEEVDGPRK